uniref:N-acetylgalactosaminide beta-1,3-galactosyltransferase n=2 Tax=Steinernema glaseri TaxID=37863 RepID=A0A1I8A9Z3_9BILA
MLWRTFSCAMLDRIKRAMHIGVFSNLSSSSLMAVCWKSLVKYLIVFLAGVLLSILLFGGNRSAWQPDQAEHSQLARQIHKEVRVLCWVMTSFKNTYEKAVHINATWAPRCNKHIFFSADPKSGLPTHDLNVTEGRDHLFGKSKAAFRYLYENELHNYDWFLKADDDTYVVVENLRLMLMAHSPEDPIYFGHKYKPFGEYMSGGAGYVLSREALRRFSEESLPDPEKCHPGEDGMEDIEMGYCLKNGRYRMLPYNPFKHLDKDESDEWWADYRAYPYVQGPECCSNYLISFHYINKTMLYVMDYLIYKVRAFGLHDEVFLKAGSNDSLSIFVDAKQFAQSITRGERNSSSTVPK